MNSLYWTQPTSGYGVSRMVPDPAESVTQPTDPPIYRALIRHWAGSGRTVPGRRDQEWTRLTAAPVWRSPATLAFPGEFSGSRGPRRDGR